MPGRLSSEAFHVHQASASFIIAIRQPSLGYIYIYSYPFFFTGKHHCNMSVARAALIRCEDGRRHAEARAPLTYVCLHMLLQATRESIALVCYLSANGVLMIVHAKPVNVSVCVLAEYNARFE